jgi:hypothetical protein
MASIKRGSNRLAGSYHFCTLGNIFDRIEINLWNTSDALSLQYKTIYYKFGKIIESYLGTAV